MIRLMLFFSILLLIRCSENNEPFSPINQTDLSNVPFVLNTENYFGFSVSADTLTAEYKFPLAFDKDSLIITLYVENQSTGYGTVSLQTMDSLRIYKKSFLYNRNDSGTNIFGFIPREASLSFKKYSGNIYFKVTYNRNANISDSTGLTIEEGSIYFNSFESSDDIEQLGPGNYSVSYDVPLGGGGRSLYVSGGCVHPHVQYEFRPAEEDGYYLLQCWGKTTSNGGVVSLRLNNRGPFIKVDIRPNGNIWNFYKSVDTLYCPMDSIMVLKMMSGGIVYSSMLVDLVQVIKVE